MGIKRAHEKDLMVGIDIGTSKVVCLVGEVSPEGVVHVVGLGSHSARGLKRGVVVNIDSTVNSIQRAVEDAELMAGCQIRSAYTGIAGSHIRGFNSHGIVAIRDNEVAQADIQRVIDAARAVAIPSDLKVLHILPQEFIVDQQDCIREPIGMSGVRLEAKVHIVAGALSAAQNIVKCIERCDLQVADVILQQLASSYAVLSDDEKELGVCLIDIGGGTTDIAVFTEGAIRYTSVVPIAGDQVTNDIAIALRTPTQNAEEIKQKYACALTSLTSPEEVFEVASVGNRPGRQLPRRVLAEVCEPRYDELLNLIRAELKRSGFDNGIAAGFVLTGGATMIPGIVELAERIFQAPVRLGVPDKITGLVDAVKSPRYSTALGLLLYGAQQEREDRAQPWLSREGYASRLWATMKRWFGER